MKDIKIIENISEEFYQEILEIRDRNKAEKKNKKYEKQTIGF